MSYAKDRKEFIDVLQEEYKHRKPAEVQALARALMTRASTSERYAVMLSSVEMTAAAQERMEQADAKNDAAIEALCKEWGLVPVFSGDPRGYTVKVILPSGRYNTWGGKECGWGVPARDPGIKF